MLKVSHLNYHIGSIEILNDISLHAAEGEFIGIIGPNGSGKSTLLKNIYKLLVPNSGEIALCDMDLLKMSNREMAQLFAVVSQENDTIFDFTVAEIVQMGRYPKKGILESSNKEDEKIIYDALAQLEMQDFIDRSFLSLSGGEKQRVFIARALAQQTPTIILDEPTNHLDIGSQVKILNLLKNSNKTVIAALHDLTLATKYCTRIYVLQNGYNLTCGKPSDVITSDLVKKLYDIEVELFFHNGNMFIDYL